MTKMKTYLLYKNKQTSLNYEALSLQQKETIEGTCRLFHKGKNVITIYGAAGTGKTTIVKFIMKKLKIIFKMERKYEFRKK